MVGDDPTTTRNREEIIQMFLDATPNEVYADGRLYTRPTDDDTIELVAYGNEVLAEVDNGANEVRLYLGHHSTVSRTVTEYVKTLGSVLSMTEGRTVDIRANESPTRGIGARVSQSAQYIGKYVGSFFKVSPFSPVELDSREEVRRACRRRVINDLDL